MGNSHSSAQHSFHQHAHDPHHRGYRHFHHPHPHHHGEVAYPPDDPRWNVHSFPRDMHHRRVPPQPMHHRGPELSPENKVLPRVLGPPPKLRATNNGAILNQGGTISGRKISQSQVVAPVKAYKAKHEKGSPASRLSANRFGGSEPDLRAPSNSRAPQAPLMVVNHQKPTAKVSANVASALANKKKYKAPPPPPKQESESPSDASGWEETGSGAPKKRLFKTRAQTSNSPAPSNDARRVEESKPRAPVNAAASAFLAKRSVSSPEFQLELVKAAQKRHKERTAAKQQAPEVQQKAATEPQNKGSPTPSGPRHAPVGRESSGEHREVKENHRPSRPRSPVAVEKSAKKVIAVQVQPPKTFYFGMDVDGEAAQEEEDEVDRFAERMRNPNLRRKRLSSGSGESYTEDEILQNDGDINLQLRPVLPKKTPDIPRFSPTAAWRQLMANDHFDDQEEEDIGSRNRSTSPILRETSGTAALLEERIVQCYSQRAPLIVRGSVATQEKSGDSGISGDASPGPGQNMLDSPDPPPVAPSRLRKHHSPVTRQWTPEQDLDESSSDEEHPKASSARSPHSRRAISEERHEEPAAIKSDRGRSSGRVTPPKFTRRSHMFSLSLPRPDQLQLAAQKGSDEIESPLESPDDNVTTFHSLKKFKKSVSGALGSAFQAKYHSQPQLSLDENWYLSRSAPNSLDSVGDAPVWSQRAQVVDEGVCWQSPNDSSSPEQCEDEDSDEVVQLGKKPLSHIASGSHIMYLPEYDSRRCMMPRIKSKQLHAGQRSLSVDVLTHLNNKEKEESSRNNNSLLIVKTNSNHERPVEMRELRPESPWEVPNHHEQFQTREEPIVKALKSKLNGKTGKKFTFQSTIRQIERRRVADRLSKEADMMEKQRKHEAEAMRKVEEEFQRKRAREKASLKEQLRLFNMHEADGPQSLPAIALDDRNAQRSKPRAEPEGQAAVKQVAKKSIYKQIAQSIQEEEHHQPKTKAEPREYKDYIANPAKINSSRYPSGERASPSPSSSSASSNTRRNVTHPAIVCDIPKSSAAYLGPIFAESDLKKAPEAHNYRREFAKGALSGGNAAAAAASRVPRAHLTPSPSPKEQDGGASRGQSQYNAFTSLPPQQANGSTSSSGSSKLTSGSKVPALQPFAAAKSKGYRPIGFKAPSSGGSPASSTKAKVIQAVS